MAQWPKPPAYGSRSTCHVNTHGIQIRDNGPARTPASIRKNVFRICTLPRMNLFATPLLTNFRIRKLPRHAKSLIQAHRNQMPESCPYGTLFLSRMHLTHLPDSRAPSDTPAALPLVWHLPSACICIHRNAVFLYVCAKHGAMPSSRRLRASARVPALLPPVP